MKKNLIITMLLLTSYSFAQIAIGKDDVNGISTLLEFDDASDNYKGLILPAVDNTLNALSSTVIQSNGTILLDKSDHKIKMYENGSWKDLTDEGNISNIQENTSSEAGDGVIMGALTSQSKGTLILESADKALILPKIQNPQNTVKSPYPGMLCYDTASKSLAIFDGNVWSYWK